MEPPEKSRQSRSDKKGSSASARQRLPWGQLFGWVLAGFLIGLVLLFWLGPDPGAASVAVITVSVLVVTLFGVVSTFLLRSFFPERTGVHALALSALVALLVLLLLSLVLILPASRRAQVKTAALPRAAEPPRHLVAVRDILFIGQDAPINRGAIGYMIFTHKPSADEKEFYVTISSSYLRNFAPADLFIEPDWDPEQLMATYWCVDEDEADVQWELLENPEWLADRYDYGRARLIMAHLNLQPRRGPLLYAMAPYVTDDRGSWFHLVLDMSAFKPKDIDRAFELWAAEISRNPALWTNGRLRIEEVRIRIRNAFEEYAESILFASESFGLTRSLD